MSHKIYVMDNLENLEDESGAKKDNSSRMASNFKPVKEALAINNVLESSKPDSKPIIRTFCLCSRPQGKKILEAFKASFNDDLIPLVSKKFKSKDPGNILRLLCQDYDVSYCILLQETITLQRGPCLAFLIQTRPYEDWDCLGTIYKTQFKKTIAEEISKHFSGELKDLFLPMVQPRDDSIHKFGTPKEEAQELTKDIKKKAGSRLISLFAHNNLQYLADVDSQFFEFTDKTIAEMFEDKLKPATFESLTVIEGLHKHEKNHTAFFLKKYLAKEKEFCYYLMLLHADEIKEIAAAYQMEGGSTLAEDCVGIYTDDKLYAAEVLLGAKETQNSA